MQLTELDMAVLKAVAHYYVLTREMVQAICCAGHASGRGTRKRLLRLGKAGYVVKHRVPVALPGTNGAAPVYYATKKGAEALASYFGSDEFLASNTRTPRADRLSHWIAINEKRLLIEAAVERVPELDMVQWVTEWTIVNQGDAKTDQYYLHTQFSEKPPLSCSPDAAFVLEFRGQRKVFFVEVDLATSSPRQIAARKSKGYDRMATTKTHRKLFPATTLDSFRVLFITTNDYRAKKTMAEMNDKPGKEHWLMMSETTLNPDNFFTGDVALDHEGITGPLVKNVTASAVQIDQPNRPHVAPPASV
ncbi:hypothetical protein RMSM_00894 [Rhodopirellula maiorica SM1]|uniref:Uncharacterized protein n=1 Tax=Rhodopirellula maiorica SM1 TaxID=1265738 RepID=M5S3H0_9BACT|nr:replication-relaxation family protein [Rhodopirellula maiorica]EMI22177.1 hypothetical protein RMSM_00894 [Rhodopirellula maiorica SM1]